VGERMEFMVGSDVACTDGRCGELKRLVVDPTARTLTHLVVEPAHRRETGRLVPVGLVASAGKEIRLSCALSEFEALAPAEVSETLPDTSVDWGYVQRQMGVPYGGGGPVFDLRPSPSGPRTMTQDAVPAGEEEVRGGDQVHATDGSIGHLRGLVTNPSDQRVTHVLLEAGHLLGHKSVAIPFSAVREVDAGIRLTLTKDEVQALPPLDSGLPE
jgi:hypothetical protein